MSKTEIIINKLSRMQVVLTTSGIGLFGIVFERSSEVVGLKIFYPYSKLTNEFFSHPVESVSDSLFQFVREPKVYVVPTSTSRHNTVRCLTELKLFQPIRSEDKLNFLTKKSLQCSSLPFVLPLQPPRRPLHHQTRRLSVFFFLLHCLLWLRRTACSSYSVLRSKWNRSWLPAGWTSSRQNIWHLRDLAGLQVIQTRKGEKKNEYRMCNIIIKLSW